MPEHKPRPVAFNTQDKNSVYDVIAARRDMRHFKPSSTVDAAVLSRLLEAANQAPSVGLMQPWRFIRITDSSLREALANTVADERQRTAEAMGERKDEFISLKVEGIRDCAELLIVVLAPDDGTVFGRRTMPSEMALCSAACAIQNLWLASRAENLGMGWVSLFDPAVLAKLLQLPENAQAIAILCLGPVDTFYEKPMLEQENWRTARPLSELMTENGWPQ